MSAADTDRLHALDAVRGFALTLGVFFHAAMSYLPGWDMWLVEDKAQSQVLGVTWFTLHIFRMSLFFLLAGFFGRLLFQRRGAAGFVRDRARRIALPLVGFWPLSIASIVGLMIWGWFATHPGEVPPTPPKPTGEVGAFPLTHLWFLYVLLWLYAGALIGRGVVARLDPSGRFRAGVDKAVAALVGYGVASVVLAWPFLVAMRLMDKPYHPFFGIPTADSNLIVNPQALAAYGTAFTFGWLLHRQPQILQVFARRWPWHLTVAAALTAACLWLLGDTPVTQAAVPGPKTTAFVVAYALAIWSWTFGLLGAGVRLLHRESPMRRYLADASYWIYIVHLPLVVALQIVAATVSLPWWIEYPAILAIAFPIMLGSYEVLVRYSWLGAILNGRRMPRPAKRAGKAALQGV